VHQLAVTGKQAAHICALICGHETKIFKVTRNETVIKYLINANAISGNVWKRIFRLMWMPLNQQPKLYNCYIQHVPLSTTDLSEDTKANQDFEQLLKQRHLIEQHQASFDQLSIKSKPKMQE
jgi:hypothetical protein